MTTQREYADALGCLPRDTFDSRTWRLLEAVEAAWAEAEDATISLNEADRWGKVCSAAAFSVGFAQGVIEASR